MAVKALKPWHEIAFRLTEYRAELAKKIDARNAGGNRNIHENTLEDIASKIDEILYEKI
jgi:hypothetical protein